MNWESPLLHKPPVNAKLDHPVWQEVAEHFTPDEFNAPEEMDVEFIRLLFRIRVEAGIPLRITSDSRDPKGSIGAKLSAHKKRPCRAIDCRIKNSYERARIVIAAVRCGIVRIGVYPGPMGDSGVLHLDAETHASNPSPRIWTRY